MLRRSVDLCHSVCAALLVGAALASSGCNLILPDISHQPTVHNPFPQLSKVAIVPFFNQSDEPTVDGREFALAYFKELQSVPGFEVVPLGVVEEAIQYGQIDLSNPAGIRQLANLLEVDVVVVGAVTDFSAYYPPRCGLHVEWYARNPGFHSIPAGYGLPWGTPDEEFIPAPLVFEAELALAKAQLATQSPNCPAPTTPIEPAQAPGPVNGDTLVPPQAPVNGNKLVPGAKLQQPGDHHQVAFEETSELEVDQTAVPAPGVPGTTDASGMIGAIGLPAMLPPDWPDERGFIPPPPQPVRPPCLPTNGPVMAHTQIYLGNNSEFTEALASFYSFQDDARFGGWQNYLQRSSDFIAFCCHMHIMEMLTARGGAGESRVVWRWPENR